MVKEETIEFFEKYKNLIKLVERHGSPEVRKIAMTIRLAVEAAKREKSLKERYNDEEDENSWNLY